MKWLETIDIKQFLNQDVAVENLTEEDVKDSAEKIAATLSVSKFKDADLAFLCSDLKNTKDVEAFEFVLNRIYDWADRRKVWLGL